MGIETRLREWAAGIRKNTKGQDVSKSWAEAATDLDAAAFEIERLRKALQHIADIAPVTDQSTGYADDSCQATARNALT